ncbi:MAG: hypothetical protein B6A08_12075 [Sorangiineae bacterium NIC37A_2]|jgi:hypothetical protein|nr:MAG: hypothetical protein B6A08_12075 [Sorangiineae bacterium NIC37A_2]
MAGSREDEKQGREPAQTGPLCRVLVIDEANVVPRGEELRVWFVKLADGWVKAHEHPAVIPPEEDAEDEGPPPGTIWRRMTELTLPLGTILMQRTTSPHVIRLDPLGYLERGPRAIDRRVRETLYRVSGNYRIEVAPRDGSPSAQSPKRKPPRGG